MALYDAFISYSHAKDKPIAAALQAVIQKLGKPWYRRRALRVFRDDTSLSATPQLWPSIQQALSESRFMILLASPEAAASPWVDKELTYWLERKSIDTLLIAATNGEFIWESATGNFSPTTPMPAAVKGRFPVEPKWVDLRGYRDNANKGDLKFAEQSASFAAAIRGMPKEDLLSQEVYQQRRALTLAWSAAALLLLATVGAAWGWNFALEQARLADQQAALAAKSAREAGTERDYLSKMITTSSLSLVDIQASVLDLLELDRRRPPPRLDDPKVHDLIIEISGAINKVQDVLECISMTPGQPTKTVQSPWRIRPC